MLDQAVKSKDPLAFDKIDKTKKGAYLKNINNNFPNIGMHNRIGYISMSQDFLATDIEVSWAGHVFGRYGQGTNAMPDKVNPFVWFE